MSSSPQVLLSPSANGSEELARTHGVGCFGQEALLGMRRRCTAIAASSVEALIIGKADLLELLRRAEFAVDTRRICRVVIECFIARERLRKFKSKLMKAVAGMASDRQGYAASSIALAWRRHIEQQTQKIDPLYQLFSAEQRQQERKAALSQTVPTLSGSGAAPGINEAAASALPRVVGTAEEPIKGAARGAAGASSTEGEIVITETAATTTPAARLVEAELVRPRSSPRPGPSPAPNESILLAIEGLVRSVQSIEHTQVLIQRDLASLMAPPAAAK